MAVADRGLLFAVPLIVVGGAAIALEAASGGPAAAPPVHQPRVSAPRPAAQHSTVTLVAGGDIAVTGGPNAGVLSGIRGYLRDSDLAVANLEGTLASGGAPRCGGGAAAGCFTFRGSPAWAGTLAAAGFDALTVSNNHAYDYGPGAQTETLAALRRAGISHAGLPGRITYLRAGKRKVEIALIGCAPYSWSQSLLDVAGSARLVRRAAKHARVVVVYMHAGAEGVDAAHVRAGEETYLGESRGDTRAFARAMVRAGADLVFASGPHVVRGMEWYRDRLVAYSLGNLAGTHTLATDGTLGVSALLRLTLDSDGAFVAGRIVPLRLGGDGTPVFDGSRAATTTIRALSQQDFGPSGGVRMSPRGRLRPPGAGL